ANQRHAVRNAGRTHLATCSRLDARGNSRRGNEQCAKLASRFGLRAFRLPERRVELTQHDAFAASGTQPLRSGPPVANRIRMRSRAHIEGHPIHPMLLPFPFAYLFGAACIDAAAYASNRRRWYSTAQHMRVIGIGT